MTTGSLKRDALSVAIIQSLLPRNSCLLPNFSLVKKRVKSRRLKVTFASTTFPPFARTKMLHVECQAPAIMLWPVIKAVK